MKVLVRIAGCCIALVFASSARSQVAKDSPAPATARPAAGNQPSVRRVMTPAQTKQLDELLGRWAEQTRRSATLAVSYDRDDHFNTLNSTLKYTGAARFQSPNLAYLDFYRVNNGKRAALPEQRYVCTGDKVYHFVSGVKKVYIYKLVEDAQRKPLDEGPLPFLFNMKVDEIKKRYEMILTEDRKDDYLIEIIPRLATDKEEFSKALVLLDKKTFLPNYLRLVLRNGTDDKTFHFLPGSYKFGAQVPPAYFDGAKMAQEVKKAGWEVLLNPLPDGGPPEQQAKGQPAANPPRTGQAQDKRTVAPRRN